eukprot:3420373-Karenia_brevis.AAC.1
MLNKAGFKCHMTLPDPELTNNTGGVGGLARDSATLLRLAPKTAQLASCMNNGRIQLLGLVLPNGSICYVVNIYGWTGGLEGNVAAMRTNDLLDAVAHEFHLLPPGPRMIVGDLNADTSHIPVLHSMLEQGQLVDIGKQGHLYGDSICTPTCRPFNSLQAFRRDY